MGSKLFNIFESLAPLKKNYHRFQRGKSAFKIVIKSNSKEQILHICLQQ